MDLFTAVEAFTQIITYVMIVAGIPSCIRMLRTKVTTGVPYPFFLAGCVNSVMAIGYGILVDNKTVIEINLFATFCNVFYIGAFIYSSQSKSLPVSQLLGCSFFVFGTYFYVTRLANQDYVMDTIGMILLFCSSVLLLTPLLQVKECIEKKNTDSLTLTMMIPGSLCCGAWATYGVLLKDFYIYGPNILGLTSYICQAIAMLVYGGGRQKSEHTD
ncbi:sugar transporter SWEET1-like [Mercenaria mercenaria]|uniref:sugar transporter SWEET1-like n=1 Tax=Mercenaria mercenaria TaxID=6596 RepID=UPI00234F3CC0|nr:sugar transporter SWEET1-like [Mercenaria mercenaria]XP_045216558.2 sugar transporter SWEET1-like [Mercenaria mercenaria]